MLSTYSIFIISNTQIKLPYLRKLIITYINIVTQHSFNNKQIPSSRDNKINVANLPSHDAGWASRDLVSNDSHKLSLTEQIYLHNVRYQYPSH